MSGSRLRVLLSLLVVASLALAVGPQRGKQDEGCPYCHDDPEILKQVGAVSHGPFPVARVHSDVFPKKYPGNPWIFLETDHVRISSNLGKQALKGKYYKQILPDLERLRAVMPDVPEKPKKLDPWLRLHLLGLHVEDAYARFQEIAQVSDEDFPESRQNEGPYMGNGRFLGEKEKFELVYHSRRDTHEMLTKDELGVKVTDALRWHFSPEHKLFASIPAEDSDLAKNEWLHPHSVHLLAHMFLCAYKHFSYDPPAWLDEGFAHAMEREVNPKSTTIDGDEGAGPHRGGHEDWTGDDKKLVKRGKHAKFVNLMRIRAFHDMEEAEHVTSWSMVRFLIEEHPEGFAKFLGGVKGQLDEGGYPTGADLPGLQRRLLKEIWNWTPIDFENAWIDWVLSK